MQPRTCSSGLCLGVGAGDASGPTADEVRPSSGSILSTDQALERVVDRVRAHDSMASLAHPKDKPGALCLVNSPISVGLLK